MFAVLPTQGEGCQLRASCLWGTCDFLWATDRPALRLGDTLRARAHESGMVALQSYAKLSARCLQASRLNYTFRPKWSLGIWKRPQLNISEDFPKNVPGRRRLITTAKIIIFRGVV